MLGDVAPKSLLGHEAAAVVSLLGREPDECLVGENGTTVWRFREGEVREVHINSSGRVFRCNYSEDRRRCHRITPAHFILALLTDRNGEETQGMVLDLAANSARIRVRGVFEARAGDEVSLDFSIPEAGEIHRICVENASVVRTSRQGESALHVVVVFQPFDLEHPYCKYVCCRQSEIAFGKKLCEREGKKCKAEVVE